MSIRVNGYFIEAIKRIIVPKGLDEVKIKVNDIIITIKK